MKSKISINFKFCDILTCLETSWTYFWMTELKKSFKQFPISSKSISNHINHINLTHHYNEQNPITRWEDVFEISIKRFKNVLTLRVSETCVQVSFSPPFEFPPVRQPRRMEIGDRSRAWWVDRSYTTRCEHGSIINHESAINRV